MPSEEDESTEHIETAQCGACQEEIPADSDSCPECGVSFSGVKEVDMGECGSCKAIVALDSKSCPNCDIAFVLDDLLQSVHSWMKDDGLSVEDMFGKWDDNDDGVLTGYEIKMGLIEADIAVLPKNEIERFIHQLDIDNDSKISLSELNTALMFDDEDEDSDSSDDSDDEVEPDSEDDSDSKDVDVGDSDEEESTEEDDDSDEDDEESDDDSEEDDESDDDSDDDDEEDDESDDDSDDDGDSDDDDDSDDDEESEDNGDSDEEESLIDELAKLVRESEDNIKSSFNEFDANKDKRISSKEFRETVEKYFSDDFDEEKIDELMEALDEDEDGTIDLIEFVDGIESPETVKETIEEKKKPEGPTSTQVWLMRNEENFFPVAWSAAGLALIMSVINVYGFFSSIFNCNEGDNAWLANNEWCANHTKLNILNIFSPSDPSSWSESGTWGIPDIMLVLLLVGLIGGSIWLRSLVKAWKLEYRKKKKTSGDSEEEESDSEDDSETEDEEQSEEEDSDDDEDDDDDDDTSEDDEEDSDDDDEDDAEIEIGSKVGVDHEGEEWHGEIIEFDEEDDEVLVKDGDSGEEYWVPFDALFVD